jgi:Fe-S-cluster containining protein
MNSPSAVQFIKRGGLRVLRPDDAFRFDCHAGLSCFTRCCRDVTIFLTPYDILRMKNALGISSEEFLAAYTQTLTGENGLPFVLLQMGDDRQRSCPFVSAEGCRIYPDRPWACRIYPLQPEGNRITEKAGRKYYSVLDVPFCEGFFENRTIPVRRWLAEQEVSRYMEMESHFKRILASPHLSESGIENRRIRQMIYMAGYDLDRFRRFVFESSFLDRFEMDAAEIEAIRTDDPALLRFAMKWLEYGLVGQQGLQVKPDVLAGRRAALNIR